MNKLVRGNFRLTRVAVATSLALTTLLAFNPAHAGAGWGDGVDLTGAPVKVPTYYANSPSGMQNNGLGAVPIDTGTALRKFVDTLPSIAGLAPSTTAGTGVGNQIPVAVPEKWVDGNGNVTSDDYYEIAIVEYSQRMHSDLAKVTRLRGYVQLETPGNAATSKHVALTYPDGTPILDLNGAQVYAYDKPHYLGPMIFVTRGTAVRMKYTNYLPVGAAKGAELFLPVDETLPGAGIGPDGVTKYTHNRAAVHLYGGDTAWISDGSPHQWISPAGESGAFASIDPATGISWAKGVSMRNVPDMPDPGPGSNTLYFPNEVSGRLMFYCDHTAGITRLNFYAGMVAGYVVEDPVEQGLVANGIIPSEQIPLVIQDKTFVPKDIAVQDAKWSTLHWGQEGDLWLPHVYETNQDPNSFDASNPVGRWDWGPWFWPIFPAQYSLPSGEYGRATVTPEAFLDTPVINGTAYPTVTVQPKAYRFRILNGSNDRFLNLSLFEADPTIPQIDPVTRVPNAGFEKEVKMVPAVPTPSFPPTWAADGRAGGAPDPALAGPDIIQIGNDGGLLPHVAVYQPQPITYDMNRRSITVLLVQDHGLYLGPGERADTVIDFSQYAGKTLILYNDAPATNFAFDPRNDYYTGDPDLSGTGGAHSTQPGYGPNTRTMMQIKVAALPPNTPAPAPFDLAALQIALPIAYGQSQQRPIIPEVAYNDAFGTRDIDNYATIFTGSLQLPTFNWTPTMPGQTIASVTLTHSGTGYTSPPAVVFNGGVDLSPAGIAAGNAAATAVATVDPVTKMVTGIQLTSGGSGYTSAPLITFTGGGGMGATASVTTSLTQSLPVYNKAIHELFEPVHGRMNSILAIELPFTNNVIQTTVPLAFIDPPTEEIADGETQIWKITHNGVESHVVHFHKLDVQLINRVGWDGTVKPPQPGEQGWKDSVVMNMLEDTVVAVRAKRARVPFGVPQSVRPLDPNQPLGSALGFTQVDLTGNPTALPGTPGYNPNWGKALAAGTIVNIIVNFDNEHVWHSQVLSREDNDFTRPVVFHPLDQVPEAPRNLNVAAGGVLTWSDPTPTVAPAMDIFGAATLGNPRNEIGFKVLRSDNGGPFVQVGMTLANATSWSDPAWNTSAVYQVIAFNAAGDSLPAGTGTMMDGLTPTALTFAGLQVGGTSATQPVVLSNLGAVPLPVGNISIGGVDALDFVQNNNCGASLAAGASCTIDVAFAPTAAGVRSAELIVIDGAGNRTVVLTGTGEAATSTLTSAAPLVFGDLQVGGSSIAQTATLTNTGAVPLPITSILVGGTDYLDFVQNNNCGVSLAAGASCTINVVFAPQSVGAKIGTLAVVDAAGTHTLTLTGTGISTPSATLTPSGVLDFGTYQLAATASAPQPVILTNTGNGPLAISKIGIDIWGGYTNFAQTNNCGTSLPVGESCTINVTYTPNLLGSRAGRLTVATAAWTRTVTLKGTASQPPVSLTTVPATNPPGAAQPVSLTNPWVMPMAPMQIVPVLGTQPVAPAGTMQVTQPVAPPVTASGGTSYTLTPTNLTFSGQAKNTASAAQVVTLTNTGVIPFTISSIGVAVWGNYQNFAQTNTCNTSLAVGASCTISVTFNPTMTGAKAGRVTLITGVGTLTVNLSGTGL